MSITSYCKEGQARGHKNLTKQTGNKKEWEYVKELQFQQIWQNICSLVDHDHWPTYYQLHPYWQIIIGILTNLSHHMKRKGLRKRSKVGGQKFMETPDPDLPHPPTQSPRKVVLQNLSRTVIEWSRIFPVQTSRSGSLSALARKDPKRLEVAADTWQIEQVLYSTLYIYYKWFQH